MFFVLRRVLCFLSRRVFSTLVHRTGVDARSPSSMAGRAVDIMPVQRMAAWAKRCQERSGTIGIIAYAANIAELNLKFEINQRLNGLAPSIGLLPLPCVFHVFEAGSSCFESHR